MKLFTNIKNKIDAQPIEEIREIINSCRAGAAEDAMRQWLAEHLPGCIDYINENDPKRCARFGGDCRKISADVYIDDKGIFCDGIYWTEILYKIRELSRQHATNR